MVADNQFLDLRGLQYLWDRICSMFVKTDTLTLLEAETIENTEQIISFAEDGNVSNIVHMRNGVAVRTDVFVFDENTITETRTLQNGKQLTIVTNTETLVTTTTQGGE